MKITGWRLYRITLHTRQPFRIAFEVLDRCQGILLLLLTDGGMTGFGEGSPARRITGETDETVAAVLKNVLLPVVKGQDPLQISEIHSRMDESIWGNPSAKAAVDMACYDLMGKRSGKPVVSLLGSSLRTLPTDHTIAIKTPRKQAEEAKKLVAQGFKILKVKLGTGRKDDVERIKAVRAAAGPGIVLRVDANQGWSVPEALSILEKIAPYAIELAEQPVKARDLKGMAFLKKRSPIPIAADESVHSPLDAMQAVEMEACDIVNIKLMKCGGIYPALQIAEVAKKARLKCMIGGMIAESRLAVSAAAHFAASCPVVRYYDLDADLLLRDNLVEKGGIDLKEGNRMIPESPGFGIEKIEKFARKFLTPIE